MNLFNKRKDQHAKFDQMIPLVTKILKKANKKKYDIV